MTRPLSALVLCLLLAGVVPAAPVPKVPPDPTKDREGNPLPKGATARIGSLAFRGYADSVAFSADGKRLLGLGAGGLFTWDADTGQPVTRKAFPEATAGNKRGLIVGDRVVWATPSRESTAITLTDLGGVEASRWEFPGGAFFGIQPGVTHNTSFAVSPDGKYLAVIPDRAKAVSVYEADSGKKLHTQKIEPVQLPGLHISPDSSTLFVPELGKPVRRWELASGKELPPLGDADTNPTLLAASPDGKRVVARRMPAREALKNPADLARLELVTVYDAGTGKRTGSLAVDVFPAHFQFAGPDALLVVGGKAAVPGLGQYTLSRWNLATLKREWEAPCPAAERIVVSPDGKRAVLLFWFHPMVHLFDAATGKPVVTPPSHTGPVCWVGFTPDGKGVVTAGGGEVAAWGLDGERKKVADRPELRRGFWNPTSDLPRPGAHLAWFTLTDDRKPAEIVGWDPDKFAVGWRIPLNGAGLPWRLVMTHDGKQVLAVDADGMRRTAMVSVYDGTTGKKTGEWPVPVGARDPKLPAGFPDPNWFPPLALSPDGKVVIAGGDRVAGLDAATGKELWRVDTGPVRGENRAGPQLALSADGSRLAVVADKSVRVYEVKTGKLLRRHAAEPGPAHTVALSPDGRTVVVWPAGLTGVLVCDADSDAKPRLLEGLTRATCTAFSPDGSKLVVGYADGTALVWDLLAK